MLCFGTLVATGCSQLSSVAGPCDRSDDANPPVKYTDGAAKNGVYMSSEWNKDLLYFPGGMHYDLEHHLGATPRWWQAYVSFDQNGVAEGSVAQASGNEVELVGMDEHVLRIRNGTCVTFWLLVAAGTTGSPGGS